LARDLGWLDRVLEEAVAEQRASAGEMLPGVYISEGEVDEILDRPSLFAGADEGALKLPDGWSSQRLVELTERCRLQPFDAAVLLIALAQGLDRRYGRLYAYLQDDLTKPFATPGLVMDLLCRGFIAKTERRARFAPNAPLLALGLLQLVGDETQALRLRPLQLDDRIASHLMGADGSDASLGARLVQEPERGLVLAKAAQDAFMAVFDSWTSEAQTSVVVLSGETSSGRRLAAQHLAAGLGRPLLVVPVSVTMQPWRPLREALLQDAVLCLAEADTLFDANEAPARAWRQAFEAAAAATGLPLILTLRSTGDLPATFAGRKTRLLRLPVAGTPERADIWRQETRLAGLPLTDAQADLLAATYGLDGGRIRSAVSRAIVFGNGSEANEHLIEAARSLSTVTLGSLGREVTPRFGWDDLVLPEEVIAVLMELVARVKHRQRVFGEWGFDSRHATSRNLSVLFSGPSGTGKTMSAEVMATDLGLPLYRVDLAAVVSKYIGETEKNLSKIFDDASASGAILFFDEADALFGKRSEVHDAHDRYANLEVSYLLQRMEEYDGIVVLASNLRNNIDEAFIRRLHFAVDFPFPDATARQEILRRILPKSTPLDPDVDLERLARRYRLSGGNIRNVVVGAAFLAAAEDTAVKMRHLEASVRREHQKMGKLLPGEAQEAER
jgi:AAA+ superfamily predicted ATPase